MTLKTILAITGRPGLFKIVTNGKNMLLVEDLISGKRFPAHSREKIVSLGDIAMYTDAEEIPLPEVFENARKLYDGAKVDLKGLIAAGNLRDEFGKVLPNFDRDRVYDNDIKKFFSWYNLLLDAGFTSFVEAEPAGEAKESAEYAEQTQE